MNTKETILKDFRNFTNQTKKELQALVRDYKTLDVSQGPLIIFIVEAYSYTHLINFLSPQFNWNEAARIQADGVAYGLFVLDLEWFMNYVQGKISEENLQKLAEPILDGWMRIVFLARSGILFGQVSQYDINVH